MPIFTQQNVSPKYLFHFNNDLPKVGIDDDDDDDDDDDELFSLIFS